MGAIWFWIVAVMLALYVVLDGFDLGVGILYPLLGRNEADRRSMLRSIGPVWDGNEVWLLAGGGTLFFAFPLVYASSFSGFYLPLMIVLWLLILRGVGIELRGHMENEVWRTFFDGMFFISSALLAIFFGAALGNVIRGVPIGPDGYFFLPLWTNWRVGHSPGILDWYTVLGGLVALVALANHGALWIAMKTTDGLERRSLRMAKALWPLLLIVTLLSLPATVAVRPSSLVNYRSHPALFLIPALVLGSLEGMAYFRAKAQSAKAFLSSCLFIVLMLTGAAAGLYPVLLPSSVSSAQDITISQALAGQHAIRVGLVWWIFGTLLAALYFFTSYWLFRGKVTEGSDYSH